ncbi:hypothetical protein GIB67_019676 [Kingdonia uniflora]|uniref:Uncharacterized protein n=1 Tax=Kingdonia uniflora TaxID=39325 RepID=A0A7J7MK38_9MAGN|nr:hypothetical protein GIB67_019676 [Kingdonia uniflora]
MPINQTKKHRIIKNTRFPGGGKWKTLTDKKPLPKQSTKMIKQVTTISLRFSSFNGVSQILGL